MNTKSFLEDDNVFLKKIDLLARTYGIKLTGNKGRKSIDIRT